VPTAAAARNQFEEVSTNLLYKGFRHAPMASLIQNETPQKSDWIDLLSLFRSRHHVFDKATKEDKHAA